MSNNKIGVLNPFNLAALMIAGGFIALTAFMPSAQQNNNRKRDSILADLQHGLRDENAISCEDAISKLTAEFRDQLYVQSCVGMAVLESIEIFGPEIACKIIRDIETIAPGSELHLSTMDLGKALPAYCEFNDHVRSEAFGAMAKMLGKAGIPLSVMDRRDALDFKVTHKDQRRYIAPVEFLSRYQEIAAALKPRTLG